MTTPVTKNCWPAADNCNLPPHCAGKAGAGCRPCRGYTRETVTQKVRHPHSAGTAWSHSCNRCGLRRLVGFVTKPHENWIAGQPCLPERHDVGTVVLGLCHEGDWLIRGGFHVVPDRFSLNGRQSVGVLPKRGRCSHRGRGGSCCGHLTGTGQSGCNDGGRRGPQESAAGKTSCCHEMDTFYLKRREKFAWGCREFAESQTSGNGRKFTSGIFRRRCVLFRRCFSRARGWDTT